MTEITAGSMFAGIGGFEEGMARAGVRTIWSEEINPFRREVLGLRFPETEIFEDVTKFEQYGLPGPDILTAGFPCQGVSLGGKGLGLYDPRTGLWSAVPEHIRALRPKFVVLENGPALNLRGLQQVLIDLAALGYDAEWNIISAAALGYPHRRQRAYIVAYPSGAGRERILCGNKKNSFQGSRARFQTGTGSLDTRISIFNEFEQRMGEPAVLGMDDGTARRVDRLGSCGSTVIPDIPEMIAHRLVEILNQ